LKYELYYDTCCDLDFDSFSAINSNSDALKYELCCGISFELLILASSADLAFFCADL